MSEDKFTPKGKEDFRSDLTKEFPDLSEEIIDKLVEKELKHQNRFSGVLKQKKNQRDARRHYKGIVIKAGLDPKTGKPYKKAESTPKGEDNQNKNQGLSEDALLEKASLLAKGYDKQDLIMMAKIQKIYKEDGKKISLDDSRKTEIFKAYRAKKDKDKKRKDAQLGPSRGGSVGAGKVKPTTEKEKSFLESMGVKNKK